MFPWQSGSNGQEETQVIHLNPKDNTWGPDLSRRQRHVNIAIAYNVWQHYVTGGDRDFLSRYGAEMVLEIARFLGSLATLNGISGRYEILGVMGPDEYHEKYPDSEEPGLRNNAYTNVMAVWVIQRALEILELLSPTRVSEISESIGLSSDEVERWQDITQKMTVPFHGEGVISQFEGYDRLKEFDWKAARARHGNITRLDRILKAEGDSPDGYKLGKQADVLMLFYLLSSRRSGAPVRRARLQVRCGRSPKNRRLLPAAHEPRLDPQQGRPRLGARRVRPRPARGTSSMKRLQADFADIQGGTTRRRESTLAPWWAPWTSSSGILPESMRPATRSGSRHACPSPSGASGSASGIGAAGTGSR